MSATNPGCIHSAGALENGKLSEATYNRIVQNIIDSGRIGFANVHNDLPCAKTLGTPPLGGDLVPEDLHDKEKYPDFHKIIMGNFEKVALALDVKGNFTLPYPLWDPFAIGLKLDLNVSFDIADLPSITIPDLAFALNIKVPDLIKLDIPSLGIPPGIPPVPLLPDLSVDLPDINAYIDWYIFNSWALKIPDFVLKLVVPDIMKLLLPLPNLCEFIKKVNEAQLFGQPEPGDITKIISMAELTVFTAKCTSIAVASLLIGDGGASGVTGSMGTKYGFRKATEDVTGKEAFPRQTTIQAYKKIFNREPTLKEVQFVQAVGRAENGYGRNWPPPPKGEKLPPDAVNSNNWGNIQGNGPAGSFSWKGFISKKINGKIEEVPYTIPYAKWGSPVEGAMALINELYVKRPYIHDAIKTDKTLYRPVYLMSAEAVLGKDWIERTAKNLPPDPNATIPMSKGGLTYYAASPTVYFNGITKSLKYIMKDLKETTDFDMVSKGSLPYTEYDYKQDLGPETEAKI